MARITQGILFNQALSDIHRSLRGATRLQQQIASGLRVNRPSDDPAAALRILPLNSEIRDLSQMIDNVKLSRETLNTGAASLEDGSSIMQRLRELIVQGANGALSEGDRESIAEEVDQILQQMASVANARRGGRYLFGGTVTDEAPFAVIADALGTRVEYRGNQDSLPIEVAPGVSTDINVPGSDIFQHRTRGATSFAGETGATSAGGIDTGVGFDHLDVTFGGLAVPGTINGIAAGSGPTHAVGVMNYAFTAPDQLSINGSAPVTLTSGADVTVEVPVAGAGGTRPLSLNVTLPISPATGSFTSRALLSIDGGATTTEVDFTDPSVRITDSFDGSFLNVDVTALDQIGRERITYEGTFDVFTTLIATRDILRNADGLGQDEVANRLTNMIGRVDVSHDQILDALRSLGFRSANMTLLENRVEGLKQTSQESLSLTRDTDIVDAIIQFNRQDLVYNAALQVGGRVVQNSLLNFLR